MEAPLQREAVQEQLERLLANPLFKNSRRYPSLLRFVVEHALNGDTDRIKERTLGVEVFGRPPGYDTNLDPVVRITAGEIRKRIAQYYHEPGHQHELRIELPPGSYIPEFRVYHPETETPAAVPAPSTRSSWLMRHRALVLGVLGVLLVGLAGALELRHVTRPTALDRFWAPVLASNTSVLLCVGQRSFVAPSAPQDHPAHPAFPELPVGAQEPRPGAPIAVFQLYNLGSQNVALPDAITLGRLTALLQSKGKAFTIRGESATTFDDLRNGPVILVGAYSNDWTLRLMGSLRFRFERENDTFWLRDNQSPNDRHLTVSSAASYLNLREDYALITRVIDSTTDRMVVVVGGITGYGTAAAGEFLTNPAYLDAIQKLAPPTWDRKNMQVVISTAVIRGVSGPPRMLAAHFW